MGGSQETQGQGHQLSSQSLAYQPLVLLLLPLRTPAEEEEAWWDSLLCERPVWSVSGPDLLMLLSQKCRCRERWH